MDEEPQAPIEIDAATVLRILAKGEITLAATMPYSSNYTLLVQVDHEGISLPAIYKPKRGERPLWDFPTGTLYKRELAAYLLSEALGLGLVPPTVARSGPYGVGMLQLFIENDEESHLFTMLKEGGYEDVIRRLCAFDALINNADRKSGHCLKALDGRLWAIDHGICFNVEYKLRTVLWDFIGEALPAEIVSGFTALRARLDDSSDGLCETLGQLLERGENRALRRRLDALLNSGTFPAPGPGPNVPWPPV